MAHLNLPPTFLASPCPSRMDAFMDSTSSSQPRIYVDLDPTHLVQVVGTPPTHSVTFANATMDSEDLTAPMDLEVHTLS